MAADVESTNLCCTKLKKQYTKMELKRNALRQAVELLELQVNKLMGENSNLKKAYEEEHMLHELEKEAKAKESIIREDPKKEIHDLKPETPSCQESGCSKSLLEDRIKLLEASITAGDLEIRRLKGLLEKEKVRGESEIGRLKGLLEKEKIRCDSEAKKAEEEKKKTAEAQKLLVMEKSTVDKERRLVEAERKNAKEYRLSLEKLKSEVNEYREKLIMEKSKANDAVKKVEAEKQKACKEKKRADLERTKSEEQRRLVEIERKKAMEERGHVDQLSQQLEEEKLRREELRTRLEETVSVEKESKCSCVASNTESTYVKLLKEKLNLEKKRVKCAKRSAHIEKAEKNILCQQINVLKQHFIQASRHLSMLDGCFNIEGKEDWTKIKESPEIQGSKLQKKLLSTKPCDFHSQSDIGLSNYSDSTKEPTGVHLSEGGHIRPMSGISSELESQINHSVRNKSQSSAVCSTTTKFSDRTFMGSQERGDLFGSASDKLRESLLNRKPSVTELVNTAGRLAKTVDVAKNTEGNVEGGHLDSSFNDGTEDAEGVSGRCTKKRRILETMESISWLYTEDSQLRLKMGEKLSALKGYLSINDGLPANIHSHNSDSVRLYRGRDLVTERHDDVNRLNYHFGIDEGPPKQQIVDFEPSIRNDNHQQIDPSETDMVCSDGAGMVNTIFQDFLKLLELDNDDDEKRYREAIGMPLSPTLPEINSPRFRIYIEDKSHHLVEKSTIRSEFERDNSVSCPTINVIDLEIYSNMMNLKASNSCELVSDSTLIQSSIDSEQLRKDGHAPFCNIEISNLLRDTLTVANAPEQASRSDQVLSLSMRKNHMEGEDMELDNTVNADCIEEKRIDSRDFLDAGQDVQTSMHLVSEYGSVESTKKTHLSTIRKLKDPSGGNCSLDGMCKFCVLFSSNREQDSISRIIHATNTIIHKLTVQTDSDIAEILRALTEITDLLLEERVSVFFSLLLFICGTSLANSKGILNDDIHLFSESFTLKIDRVISDGETNWLFNDMCQLEILLNLIEDFLINRRIVMYDDMIQSKQFSPGISFSTATVDQLVSASIIFTCICVSVNHIGFILKASYKILRSCREDTYWTLSVLHVFASLAGKIFFTSNDHNFLQATISSVVSLIERGPESHTSITPRHSACDAVPIFHPCDECPFYSKTVSLDRVTHSLLDALQNYMLKECIERPEACNDDLDLDCDASCMLLNYRKNDTGYERSFCHYTDIISLVELVGCYKCWDWTSNNIIPRLLEILESCVSEDFAAALFILIGQITMFGINTGGYQQTEVVNLRCNLAIIVDAFIARKKSFPTELAAVGTLLDLLPFDFQEIVDGCLVHIVDASELGHVQLIKKWFSQLSRELQSLSLSLFRRTAAIQKT